MSNPEVPPRPRAAVLWLIAAVVAGGLAALVAALIPTDSLRSMAERLGHADDVTPERIARLRIVGVGLAAANLLLAGYLATAGRGSASRFLSELGQAIVGVRPIDGLRRTLVATIDPGWLHVTALLFVLVVAVATRLSYLRVPMDYDEAYSFLNYARRPLHEGLADYNSTNNHLLNTLFMHLAFVGFGPQEWALRLHVFVAGIGTVVTTYVLGRRMLGADGGLLAAASVATSYEMVNYSVNARGYVWAAWMTALLLLACWRIAAADDRPAAARWVAASLAAVLGLFAIPTMIYPILGCYCWLAFGLLRRRAQARVRLASLEFWAIVIGLTTIWLYAPALVFRGVAPWLHPFVAPLSIGDWAAREPAAWLLALQSLAEGPVPWLVLAVLFGIGLVVLGLLRRDAFWLLLAVVLATFFVMMLQRVTPPPRVFSFLAPVFAIAVSAGVVGICRLIWEPARMHDLGEASQRTTPVCAALAFGLCLWAFLDSRANALPGGLRPTFLVEDVAEFWSSNEVDQRTPPTNQLWRLDVPEAVRMVQSDLRPGGRVLVGLPVDLPFHFYAARNGWTTPIGGQPQPGEQLYLVVRADEDPRVALRENLSLRITDSAVLQADWQLLARGHLAIWRAQLASAEPTASDSR